MSRTDDIVGYTYRADLYCPGCILTVVVGTHNRITTDPEGEYGLPAIAAHRGIDRDDESTFDSGDFPKVVFRDQVRVSPPDYCEDTDRCGACGKVLGWSC